MEENDGCRFRLGRLDGPGLDHGKYVEKMTSVNTPYQQQLSVESLGAWVGEGSFL